MVTECLKCEFLGNRGRHKSCFTLEVPQNMTKVDLLIFARMYMGQIATDAPAKRKITPTKFREYHQKLKEVETASLRDKNQKEINKLQHVVKKPENKNRGSKAQEIVKLIRRKARKPKALYVGSTERLNRIESQTEKRGK